MSNRRRVYPGESPSAGQPDPVPAPQQVPLYSGAPAPTHQQGPYAQPAPGGFQQPGNQQYSQPQGIVQPQPFAQPQQPYHQSLNSTPQGYNSPQFSNQQPPNQPLQPLQPLQPNRQTPPPTQPYPPPQAAPPPPQGRLSPPPEGHGAHDPHGHKKRVYPADVEGHYEAGGVEHVDAAMSNMSVSGQPGAPQWGAAPGTGAPRPFPQPGQFQPAAPQAQYAPQGQYPTQGQYPPQGQQYPPQQGGQQAHGSAAEYQAAPSVANQCPPAFMRMTINAIPATQSLLTKSSIPLGVIVHPLKQSTKEDEKVPVVSFGTSTIVRCRRCRAYINPFVAFTDSGRRWRCNICDAPNEIPSDYFAYVDPVTGVRQDITDRPELQRGCVEFIAPSEYMVRAPQPPVYFFMIDVCYAAVSSGMLKTCIQAIKNTLDNLGDNNRTQIGFITYDRAIHFYNLRSGLSQPQMMVVPDIENLFVPLCDDLLVSLKESRALVDNLLDKLPTMFTQTQQVESAFGSALKSAFNVIKHIGGKLLVFQSSLPLLGVGKLENREDPKILGTDKETTLFNPSESTGGFYKDFALDCSRQQIAVDLFLFPSAFIDVATLGVMPQITGGELFYYPSFKSEKHDIQVIADIQKDLTRYTSWEGVVRVRCSKGLKIVAHHGNFFIRSTDLLAIPNTDEDKAFAFQLSLTENLTGTKYGAIQSAVLYTNSSGERRIRVQTVSVPITTNIPDLFRHADCGAITNLVAKMAIDKIQTTKLADAREAIVNKCVDILAVYRDTFGNAGAGGAAPASTQAGQLLIPENLRLLPLYVLALAKSPLFRPIDVRPDERVYHLHRFKTLPVDPSLNFIYPSLFNISTLTSDVVHTLPPVLNLSSEKLDRRSLFLLDNNLTLTIYVPKQVAPAMLHDVFGVDQFALLEPGAIRLPVLNTEINHNLRNLISLLERRANRVMRLDVIREGDVTEAVFLVQLVEDRNRAITSYYEFMVQLQRSVAAKGK